MIFLFTEIDHPEVLDRRGTADADHVLASQLFQIEEALARHGAHWTKRTATGVLSAFEGGDGSPSPPETRPGEAALALQKEFQSRTWEDFGKARIKIALHAGEAESFDLSPSGAGGQDYVGPEVHHALKLLEAARGGQTLLTVPAVHFIPLPPGSRLRDLGRHCLKDLSPPQNLYALTHPDTGEGVAEPPRSLEDFPQNFFPQASPFFGREEEMVEITDLLSRTETRLVTLTGPGGFGKTRLAFQAAAEVIEKFKDGVFTVSLAPLLSDHLLVASVASAVKFFFYGPEDPKAQLLAQLREKRMLLVMDNFEHIIEGAELVGEMLSAAPGLKILATSREKLGIGAEKVFEVKGLRYPREDSGAPWEASSAVQLFLKGARRVRPDFTLAPEDRAPLLHICRSLEGMPLGLELSATWVGTLTLPEIAGKIESSRDFLATSMPYLPPRHRSLRAVFEYSWILLAEAQKKALKALSVFRGGFTEAAMGKVAGGNAELLEGLARKSLVRRKEGRWEIHELLKYYAKEKLFDDPREKEKALDAHCRYFAGFTQGLRGEFVGPSESKALEELTAEMGNIREGWARAVERVMEKELDGYLDGLFFIFETKGWFQEAKETFWSAVLSLKEKYAHSPMPVRSRELLAKLLCRWADFEKNMANFPKARQLYEESLKTSQSTPGGPWGWALAGMGIVCESEGDHHTAKAFYGKSFKAFWRARDRSGITLALNHLGHISSLLGNSRAVQSYARKSLSYSAKDGDQRAMGYSYSILGEDLYEASRFGEARGYFQKGLAAYLQSGDRRGAGWCFTNLGRTAQGTGDFAGALQMYNESTAVYRDLGDLRALAGLANLQGYLEWAVGRYAEAQGFLEEGLFYYKEVRDPRGQAWSLDLMANLKLAQGEDRQAETLYRQSYALLAKEGLNPKNKAWHAYHLGKLAAFRKDLPESQKWFRQSLKLFENPRDDLGQTLCLIQLGEAACGKGLKTQARSFFRRALKTALSSGLRPALVDGVAGVARLLKEEGDEHQALGFLHLVLAQGACHRETRDWAALFLAELESRSTPEEIEGARQWAKTTRLEDVAAAWIAPRPRNPQPSRRSPAHAPKKARNKRGRSTGLKIRKAKPKKNRAPQRKK